MKKMTKLKAMAPASVGESTRREDAIRLRST